MKSMGMLDFRVKTAETMQQLKAGQSFLLTYRGKPVATVSPVAPLSKISVDDPFYNLHVHAEKKLKPVANAEIDKIVYGI